MDPALWESLDPQRSRLRALVTTLNDALSDLAAAEKAAGRASSLGSVQSAWADLERSLALGPEPELRVCPSCSRSILSVATRCRYCFVKSAADPNGRAQQQP